MMQPSQTVCVGGWLQQTSINSIQSRLLVPSLPTCRFALNINAPLSRIHAQKFAQAGASLTLHNKTPCSHDSVISARRKHKLVPRSQKNITCIFTRGDLSYSHTYSKLDRRSFLSEKIIISRRSLSILDQYR